MDTHPTEKLQSLSKDLDALSKAELIELVLAQRQSRGDRVPVQPSRVLSFPENRATENQGLESRGSENRGSESQGSIAPSRLDSRLAPTEQVTFKSPASRPAWLVLLISLSLHGVLLAIPMPVPPVEEEVTEEPEFLLPLANLPPAPTEPAPPPEAAPPPEPSPVPQVVAPPPAPIPPLPQAAPPPAIQPAPPATPQPAPQPTPQAASPPEPEPVDPVDLSLAIAPPEPEPEPDLPAGPTDISGVPVSSNWQLISQFQDLQQKTQVSDSQWYSDDGGQLRDDIVGLLQISDEDFDQFWTRYQEQLTEAGFKIQPQGRAPGGAILYQLSREGGNGRLYLSVESIEAENEILLGIWNRYPW